MKKNLLTGFLIGLLLLGLAGVTNAALIEFQYDATFSAVTSDPLGIDGESFSLNLVFDDTDTWKDNPVDVGTVINFPTVSAGVSISGGHSISLNTTSPVAYQVSFWAGLLEKDDTISYLDFIINGTTTTMTNFRGAHSVYASIGDNLLVGHLPSSMVSSASTWIDWDTPDQIQYEHLRQNVTINTVNPIPEPTTMLLLGTGLVGVAGAARRKKKNKA